MPTIKQLTPELAAFIREQGIDLTTGKPIVPEPASEAFPLDCCEEHFQAAVIKEAKAQDWMHYHTWDSRRSVEGFPDLILVRVRRLIVAELKTAKGKVSAAQKKWINAFRMIQGVEVHVWRPADWHKTMEALK